MRKGWKEWMDAGSPELTSETKRKYKFDSRFLDDMLRVSWDTAFTYTAKAMIIIATRYSGEAGARRLREQGYAPEMIEMMKGAGTRTFKHRAGMPVLGIIGKMVEYVGRNAPLTDHLRAEEVGMTTAFLCSPLASGITGTTVYVDKGFHTMGMAVQE